MNHRCTCVPSILNTLSQILPSCLLPGCHRALALSALLHALNSQWLSILFTVMYVLCLVVQSCLTLCKPTDCSLPVFSVHGDAPGKNTRVGCHALLHGIFPTQGLSPGLPHCKGIPYSRSHQGSTIELWFTCVI